MKVAKNSPVIYKERLEIIKQYLEDPLSPEVVSNFQDRKKYASFKHQVKTKGYCLKIEDDGSKTVVVPCKSDVSRTLKVVCYEEFTPVIKSCHEGIGHAGENATFKKVQENYFGVIRTQVRDYLKSCPVCSAKASRISIMPTLPLISQKVFERIHIDLIDMRTQEANGFKYILHSIDHTSKFHYLWPLQQKTCENVKAGLRVLFGFTGVPEILQCDNGSEFSDKELNDVLSEWPSHCKIIHSRSRHLQSQGLIERGHRVVRDKIASLKAEYTGVSPFPWHLHLSKIMYMINTTYTASIKCTPYERVFGRTPPAIALRESIPCDQGDDEVSDDEV